tara:strand:+ start:67 stop:732 length:666 start_codon:yes stop_codon:yes gene_type:complete
MFASRMLRFAAPANAFPTDLAVEPNARYVFTDYDGTNVADRSPAGNDLTGVGGNISAVTNGVSVSDGSYFDMDSALDADALWFVFKHEQVGTDINALIGDSSGSNNTSFIFIAPDTFSYAISVDGSNGGEAKVSRNGASEYSGDKNVGPTGAFNDKTSIARVRYTHRNGNFDVLGKFITNISRFMTGELYEVIAFADYPSAGDVVKVENYLNAKYGGILDS